ncbi:hypothetical protein BS50DRAFT_676298 [Corynespora cassiicola Philippines]|uniref:Uncharacterized protein n=1 Tax=Corynespora cassiicola Philippines TaxID=1448308 RepID=A0A2T2NSU2_CORCC|nr:hypothetical protein BS50DRAFT_676298 [Corynespora cassiicola Philippines]
MAPTTVGAFKAVKGTRDTDKFQGVANNCAHKAGCTVGTVQPCSRFEENDRFDDKTESRGRSEKEERKLKRRFLNRVAELLAASTRRNAVSFYRESERAEIYVKLDNIQRVSKETQQMIENLQNILRSFQGSSKATAKNDLTQFIQDHFADEIKRAIDSTKQLFSENEDCYQDLITRWSGGNDEFLEKLDDRIFQLLFDFRKHVINPESAKVTLKEINLIIDYASKFYEERDLLKRLRYLPVRSRYGEDIFDHICLLVRPNLVSGTLRRVASANPTFACVEIKYGFPAVLPKASKSMAPPNKPDTKSSSLTTKPVSMLRVKTSPSSPEWSHTTMEDIRNTAPSTKVSKIETLEVAAREYLTFDDKGVGALYLSPIEKGDALILAMHVLNATSPIAGQRGYYSFGYPACRDEDEISRLSGMYQQILVTSHQKQDTFQVLWASAKQGQMIEVLDGCIYKDLWRETFPRLESFFKQESRKPSVWRLIEFIRTDSTDAPADLRRDYGFERPNCPTREEIQKSKDLYWRLLRNIEPLQLHKLCIQGTPQELKHCVHVDPHEERYLRNRYPMIGLGFESQENAYRSNELFKKRGK